MAAIWAEALQLPQVGIHDNFFDLGGASFAALEIMSRLNDAGVVMDSLDPTQIFELQTIAQLAAALTLPQASETVTGTLLETSEL